MSEVEDPRVTASVGANDLPPIHLEILRERCGLLGEKNGGLDEHGRMVRAHGDEPRCARRTRANIGAPRRTRVASDHELHS